MSEDTNYRPLKEFSIPSNDEPHPSIVYLTIQANDFKLKPFLFQIVQQNQFSGKPAEDPNLYLFVFVEFADTRITNGVNPEVICLRLSHFP